MRLPHPSCGFRLVAHESEIGELKSRPDRTANQGVDAGRPGGLPLARGDDLYRFLAGIERSECYSASLEGCRVEGQ